MSPASVATLRRRSPVLRSTGGLIVFGGPPFQGKSVLAARVTELLPNAYKLEVIDNLSSNEHWYPEGPTGDRLQAPLRSMLDAALEIWNQRSDGIVPAIVIAARVETPALRRLARETAQMAGMRFLYVEALSSNIRALRQLSSMVLSEHDLLVRMRRYSTASSEYVPVSHEEIEMTPALALRNVLADPDAAVRAVLARWASS